MKVWNFDLVQGFENFEVLMAYLQEFEREQENSMDFCHPR
jgi:hypothetical protein